MEIKAIEESIAELRAQIQVLQQTIKKNSEQYQQLQIQIEQQEMQKRENQDYMIKNQVMR